MKADRPRLGIFLMIAATFAFAAQDGISRYLAGAYNTYLVVAIRYVIFTAIVVAIFSMRPGGLRRVMQSQQTGRQILRGVILVFEILITIQAFVYLGLIETHALFAGFPLLVAALSGPVLGEWIGVRRWLAIGVGFLGVLILLRPGFRALEPALILPLLAVILFAFYQLLTRKVAATDSAETSFVWTALCGFVVMMFIGPFFWQPIALGDWGWLLLLSLLALAGHFMLIKALEVTEAGTVQPFTYFHLIFVTIFGVAIFGETLDRWTVIGAGIVVSAGLFTLFRQAKSSA